MPPTILSPAAADRRASNMGKLYILLSAFFWSFSGVGIKFVNWNPIALSGWRSLFTAALLIGISLAQRKARPFRIVLNRTTILSAAAMTATLFLFVSANKFTTSANAIVIQYSAPIFVVLYQLLFQKRRPLGIDMVALAVMMGGLVLFFFDGMSASGLLGIRLAVVDAAMVGLYYWMSALPGADPMSSSIMAHLATALIGAPFLLLPGNVIDAQSALAVVLMGIVQLGMGYYFFSKGISHTPPVDALLISMLEPLLSPIWVLIVMHEVPGPVALAGAAVVLLTVVGWNMLKMRAAARAEAREKAAG